MSTQRWHDDDDFWRVAEPVLFDGERQEKAPGEIERLLALTGLSASARMLDLCCGVGRHSLELARRGFRVTGVDRTRFYLDKAAEAAAAEQLDIELVEEDIRSFRRPGAYDGAINLFSSFGYFEDRADDLAVARNMASSLRDGGVMAFDTMSKEVLARSFAPNRWTSHDGVLLLEDAKIIDNWSCVTNHWIIIEPNGRRLEVDFELRIYSAYELIDLLQEAGFSSADAFGGLDGTPYDQDAERLVVVARK